MTLNAMFDDVNILSFSEFINCLQVTWGLEFKSPATKSYTALQTVRHRFNNQHLRKHAVVWLWHYIAEMTTAYALHALA